MFQKILIANRGEIAVRVIRTAREMGLKTVAVYSEVDARAAHVIEADQALSLGPAEPSESYLNIDRIIQAARASGAEAIHPGYGFLAENPDFAAACEEAGLAFIGPPAGVIRDLGSKTEARRIMASAGVPIIPGTAEGTTDVATVRRQAEEMGFPILVKAVAGGGGKGMRVVAEAEEMAEACQAAISEAAKAFGDGRVYLEKNLVAPRHVEFQILADGLGHAIHLFERECSIQRRHQKIIEETPSTALTPQIREAMGRAAVTAAQASGYVGAGTVEFLLDQDGKFYFLEVNTRLQVEHPITEMTTGVDLVRRQIEIAAGEPLGLSQEDVAPRGHAIECRIYAEDPAEQFFPSPGKITLLREPVGPGVRVDSGIYEGFTVPVEYDPILSKLIVWAHDREAARQRMVRALGGYAVLGIETTVPFLLDVIESAPFREGETRTDFIERHFTAWRPSAPEADVARMAFVIDELRPAARPTGGDQPRGWPTPWQSLGRWTI
ncbi:MAG: acetyl-CoA carboxylase biotin carboxylase subunit [Proteobacteria bacterium]|nr:acetyl-CoA carboxylase biotin carboxylase subunit [Pseudomonadota bacterium]